MKKIFLLLLVVPLILNAGELDDKNYFGLAKGKAGFLKIGMTVDELYHEYGKNSTKLVDLYQECMFCPAIEIYINGNKEKDVSLVAEITEKKIGRFGVLQYMMKDSKQIKALALVQLLAT